MVSGAGYTLQVTLDIPDYLSTHGMIPSLITTFKESQKSPGISVSLTKTHVKSEIQYYERVVRTCVTFTVEPCQKQTAV